MWRFIAKRLGTAVPTLLLLVVGSFFLMRLAPGGPFTAERPLPPADLTPARPGRSRSDAIGVMERLDGSGREIVPQSKSLLKKLQVRKPVLLHSRYTFHKTQPLSPEREAQEKYYVICP